jgi:hypothetical protein
MPITDTRKRSFALTDDLAKAGTATVDAAVTAAVDFRNCLRLLFIVPAVTAV